MFFRFLRFLQRRRVRERAAGNLAGAKALAAIALLCGAALFAGVAPASAPHAMVVTEQHDATLAGLAILRRGGNAVDAAIAAAYALAVVDPCCGNIGGGGFMLVRLRDGRERFIDFREQAPLRATPRMYLDRNGNVIPQASTKGYLAVGVPGTVLGLEQARSEFATLPRAQLMAPAIALAARGYRLRAGDAAIFAGAARGAGGAFTFSARNVRTIFMPRGRLPRPGDLIVQPQLAQTLRRIAQGGAAAFYRGPIAAAIVAASRAHGGILSLHDFASYRVGEQQPLHCAYRGYTISSAPPPSSGGVTLCEILGIIEGYPMRAWGWNSVRSAHYAVEAERRAYADRNTYLGDPAFVRNPVAQLLAPAYLAHLRAGILPDRATPSEDVHPGLGPIREGATTTHLSVVDRFGNAAALTYTINDWFGAGVIAGSTGFFLNDEMDDFTSKAGVPNMYGLVQGSRNAIAPRKRPLSSMTPTIVTKGGKLFMVTGSPGGSRIMTIVLATLQNVIEYGMNVQDAVDAKRIHMQWLPDQLEYEAGALSVDVRTALEHMGYRLVERGSWGSAQAIVVDPRTGIRFGGTDPRGPSGLAAGY